MFSKGNLPFLLWVATFLAVGMPTVSAAQNDWTCSAAAGLCGLAKPGADGAEFDRWWVFIRGGGWERDCAYPAGWIVPDATTMCGVSDPIRINAKTLARDGDRIALAVAIENVSAGPVVSSLFSKDPVSFASLRADRDGTWRVVPGVEGRRSELCGLSETEVHERRTLSPGERRIVVAEFDPDAPSCPEIRVPSPRDRTAVCIVLDHGARSLPDVLGPFGAVRRGSDALRLCARPGIAGCPAFDELCERISPLGTRPEPRDLRHLFLEGDAATNDCRVDIEDTDVQKHVCGPDSPVRFAAKLLIRTATKVAVGLAVANASDGQIVTLYDVSRARVTFTKLRIDRGETEGTRFDVGEPAGVGCGPPERHKAGLSQLVPGMGQIVFATLDVGASDCEDADRPLPTGPMLVCLHFAVRPDFENEGGDGRYGFSSPSPDHRSCTVLDGDRNALATDGGESGETPSSNSSEGTILRREAEPDLSADGAHEENGDDGRERSGPSRLRRSLPTDGPPPAPLS